MAREAYRRHASSPGVRQGKSLRIYDGPDEVHLQTIARLEANEQSLAGLEHYLHE